MKKTLSIILALVLALSLSVTAFAEEMTITINGPDKICENQDYEFTVTASDGVTLPTVYTYYIGAGKVGDVPLSLRDGVMFGTLSHELYGAEDGTFELYVGANGYKCVSISQDHIYVDGICGCGAVQYPADKTDITVNGTYTPGTTADDKISVDIVWDAMDFTYTAPSQGTWNPATHVYEGATEGGWSDNTPSITVTNHSNVAVNATLGFTADVDGVIGTFTEASGTENDSILELATAEGTEVANAPTATAKFGISGAAIDANKTIGTITVTIENVIDTFAELQAAVNAGGTVKLGGNITLGDETLVVGSSVPVILDLNGYTLTSNSNAHIQVQPGVICTVKNGTVTNTYSDGEAVYNFGTLTVQNCTLNANNYFPLYNCCTATVTDSTLNRKIIGNSICNAQAYSDTVTLTLSGTVRMDGGIYNHYIASVVTALAGTYNFDPTSYVDTDTYTVTDNGDGTWTVAAK